MNLWLPHTSTLARLSRQRPRPRLLERRAPADKSRPVLHGEVCDSRASGDRKQPRPRRRIGETHGGCGPIGRVRDGRGRQGAFLLDVHPRAARRLARRPPLLEVVRGHDRKDVRVEVLLLLLMRVLVARASRRPSHRSTRALSSRSSVPCRHRAGSSAPRRRAAVVEHQHALRMEALRHIRDELVRRRRKGAVAVEKLRAGQREGGGRDGRHGPRIGGARAPAGLAA